MKIPLEQIHTSPETAYMIEDYPYGFRLRCKMRVWIETKKSTGEMRVMRQTTNPKVAGEVWNKAKASTYEKIKVLYIDSNTGYIESAGWHGYDSADFLADFGEILSELQVKKLTVHYAGDIVTSQGISLYNNGRAEFYAKLKEVLTELGQDDLIKFIGA